MQTANISGLSLIWRWYYFDSDFFLWEAGVAQQDIWMISSIFRYLNWKYSKFMPFLPRTNVFLSQNGITLCLRGVQLSSKLFFQFYKLLFCSLLLRSLWRLTDLMRCLSSFTHEKAIELPFAGRGGEERYFRETLKMLSKQIEKSFNWQHHLSEHCVLLHQLDVGCVLIVFNSSSSSSSSLLVFMTNEIPQKKRSENLNFSLVWHINEMRRRRWKIAVA